LSRQAVNQCVIRAQAGMTRRIHANTIARISQPASDKSGVIADAAWLRRILSSKYRPSCHWNSGFLVEPNDPADLRARLRWLKDHPAEAAAMGEAARRRVLEKFTWDAVVDRCLAAYGKR
jgi:glycosyltransferase involved in cell wall biosynthesis